MSRRWSLPACLALTAIAWLGCGIQYENERPPRYLDCSDQSNGCICGHEITVDPGATRCSAASVSGMCCATGSWPDGGSCSCGHVGCEATAEGCACSADTSAGATACEGAFTTCCFDPDDAACICSSAEACEQGQTQVQACTVSLFTCSLFEPGGRDVEACSEGPVTE